MDPATSPAQFSAGEAPPPPPPQHGGGGGGGVSAPPNPQHGGGSGVQAPPQYGGGGAGALPPHPPRYLGGGSGVPTPPQYGGVGGGGVQAPPQYGGGGGIAVLHLEPNGSNDHQIRRSSSTSRSSTFRKKRSKSVVNFKQTFKTFHADPESPGPTAAALVFVSCILILLTLPFSLCCCIKVVQEYERAVIFRLGRLRKGGAKGPGIFFVVPCVDSYKCVDLRTVSFDVPPQEILSRDSVTVSVDAVVYFNVIDSEQALCSVDDFSHSTRLLAATTLRNVLGTKNLAEILSDRETIAHIMQNSLDEATDPWGVKVERVEIKDVRLPVQLQRAMAAEAEAAREARAKVIAAEGEQKASRALKEAADVIQESPSALQLRYLQTLNSIAAEHNSTIIFPMPIDLIKMKQK